jgi:hypothetical protein
MSIKPEASRGSELFANDDVLSGDRMSDVQGKRKARLLVLKAGPTDKSSSGLILP